MTVLCFLNGEISQASLALKWFPQLSWYFGLQRSCGNPVKWSLNSVTNSDNSSDFQKLLHLATESIHTFIKLVLPPMRDSVNTQNVAISCLYWVLFTRISPMHDYLSLGRKEDNGYSTVDADSSTVDADSSISRNIRQRRKQMQELFLSYSFFNHFNLTLDSTRFSNQDPISRPTRLHSRHLIILPRSRASVSNLGSCCFASCQSGTNKDFFSKDVG